ncbi:unnamed protein product [Moneuplotes crassus]|uniref:Uncharacterized protein n=1 Tax=Euplotes crassus TaxID=5936 RepID=A0AAD2D8J4_EUPCR|nr:unnamed protein product [Moneuplotes crassus]
MPERKCRKRVICFMDYFIVYVDNKPCSESYCRINTNFEALLEYVILLIFP